MLQSTSERRAAALLARYRAVRAFTETLCAPLTVEDHMIQSMPDASPARWHLGHTTWFFQMFVLRPRSDYTTPDPMYEHLFNSYYNAVGSPYPRPKRGIVSRPTVAEVREWRRLVDEHVERLLQEDDPESLVDVLPVIEIGLHHEQQHQELILTDVKHGFFQNPIYPTYERPLHGPTKAAPPARWLRYDEGLRRIGHDAAGFSYDNERPRHRVFLEHYELGSRLVTNGEYLRFIEDGGYGRHEHWLSEGWDHVRRDRWRAPLYWVERQGGWWEFTLRGLRRLDLEEPVVHVSYYEADAFARWAGARLPTEAEWEAVATTVPVAGNFVDTRLLHPTVARETPASRGALAPVESTPLQMFGDAWEWTSSPYAPYPGYEPLDGALGEYNGKFMANQFVLRGGSCASTADHLRASYRNFFPAHARWQFSGIRLAR